MYIVRNPKNQHNLPFWKTKICFNFHFTSTIHLQPPWVRKPKHCIQSWHEAQRLGSERGTVRYVSGHVPIIKLHSLTLNSIFLHYIQVLQTIFSFTSWLLIRLWSWGFWKRIGKLEEGKKKWCLLAFYFYTITHVILLQWQLFQSEWLIIADIFSTHSKEAYCAPWREWMGWVPLHRCLCAVSSRLLLPSSVHQSASWIPARNRALW